MPTTPRLALQHPATSDPATAYRTMMQNNAVALDTAAIHLQGTLAARPAAGLAGRYYYATDTGRLFLDIASAWVDVGTPADGSVTNAKLADDAVTAAKLAANSVDSSAIQGNAVNSGHLQDEAVSTDHLQFHAVTDFHMSANAKIALMSGYKTISEAYAFVSPGSLGGAAGVLIMADILRVNGTNIGDPIAHYHIDPAEYTIPGLLTRFRIKGMVTTNGTAPGVGIEFSMRSVISSGGGVAAHVVTLEPAFHIAGSGITLNVGANAVLALASTDFAPPAAGPYCHNVHIGAPFAANFIGHAYSVLQYRHVLP